MSAGHRARHRARGRPARFRFASAGIHLLVTMPWGPVLAACLTGIGVSLAGYWLAARSQQPGEILMWQRLAFAPVVVAVAVLVQDEHQPLVTALPAPAWLTTAARVVIVLPVLVLTGWTQLAITAAELGATPQSASVPASALPWLELTGELAAWSAIALAAAAIVGRTRWSDIGSAIAVPAALAIVGMLALPAWHLLPTSLSPARQPAWASAERAWWVMALLAVATVCWASRDPWLRLATPRRRGSA